MAEFLLEESILDVLLEARLNNSDGWVALSEISKQAGIFRDGKSSNNELVYTKDAIAAGILNKLDKHDRVEHSKIGKKWRVADQEFRKRVEDKR